MPRGDRKGPRLGAISRAPTLDPDVAAVTDRLLRRAGGRNDFLTFWRRFLESPEYLRNAVERMMTGYAPHLESYIWARIHGKPVEHIELSGPGGQPIHVHQHFATDETGPALVGSGLSAGAVLEAAAVAVTRREDAGPDGG